MDEGMGIREAMKLWEEEISNMGRLDESEVYSRKRVDMLKLF